MDDESQMTNERRKRQRFVARRRGGEYCFWVEMNDHSVPLQDLSMEGFGFFELGSLSVGQSFEFVLRRLDIPDRVRGVACVVNKVATTDGLQAGVIFESMEDTDRELLQDWLTAHVLITATLPISEQDASLIVSGPSLI